MLPHQDISSYELEINDVEALDLLGIIPYSLRLLKFSIFWKVISYHTAASQQEVERLKVRE